MPVVTFGAALVLAAEHTYPGSNIRTFGEAVWWVAVTTTTVGYGNYVPVSPTGAPSRRSCCSTVSRSSPVITATVAAKFVADPDDGERSVSLDDLDERLARIEAALESLALAEPTSPQPSPRESRQLPPDEPGAPSAT